MTITFTSRLLAATIAISALTVGVAQALPVAMPSDLQPPTGALVQAQYFAPHQMHNGMNWQAQRYGNRCRTRSGMCQHYHQGYYYETPWWTLPLIVGSAVARNNGSQGGSHVEWCLSHYRSYNQRTDMWVGNNGRSYRCNSGY